jgi:aldehyde:ferredoxin oxidoreductase
MLTRKIAYIDLSRGTVVKEVIPSEWRHKYLGGRGINALLLYSLVEPGYNPLGPENPLLFGGGWLNGVPGFGPARGSNQGGFFGSELKYAGFDHLVITGKSDSPVYLFVKDGDIEIRDARHLWGKDVWETQQIIRKEHADERIASDVIGVAGENLVRMANIITGPKNAAGRCGMGAVMGSKRLKAVAVRGTGDVIVAHPQEVLTFLKQQNDKLLGTKWAQTLHRFGTPLLVEAQKHHHYSKGGLGRPVADFTETLNAKNMEPHSEGMSGCFGCAVQCRHRFMVKEGKYKGLRSEGPEFCILNSSGFVLENMDLEGILYSTYLTDRLGLDQSATHLMINYAMNMFEQGIITRENTDMDLTWGDADLINRLLVDIAYRRGFGDILADGPDAAKRLPPEAGKYIWTFKGNLPLGTSQRIVRSLALGMLVSTIPGHQHRGDPGIDPLGLPADVLENFYGAPIEPDFRSYQGRGLMVRWHEMLHAIVDSLGCCRFQEAFTTPHGHKFEEFSKLIWLLTDIDMPVQVLKDEIGERIVTTERLFLGKMGVGSREHDEFPWVFYHPFAGGKYDGEAMDREKVQGFLDEYYAQHGWDNNGVPTEELVQRLEIEKMARQVRKFSESIYA